MGSRSRRSVGDLNDELVFESHHKFYRVEAIKSKIVLEVRAR